MKRTLLATALLGLCASQQVIAAENTEPLRQVIAEQQQVLADLEKRLAQTESRIEQTADALEGTASTAKSATTIGGYGELHYNNISDNIKGTDKKEFDFHRFVLFFGHEFTPNTRFFSELEVEHSLAGEGKKGEVELEQAYIEHDFNQRYTGKAGLFLMPVGIINETHEPPTFYGVERNPVEANIIPATWWEGGAALAIKAMPGLAFDVAVTSG
ncbi:MAG: porin, partial [Shewanella sp.]